MLYKELVEAGCEISVKTCVLANDPAVAAKVQKALARQGLRVPVESEGRDLGVDTAAGKRRVLTVAKGRMAKAKARAVKVGRLARITRRATRLHTSGSAVQARWGMQALGASPSTIRQLRAQAASAL
eukprot:6923523-Alexandrium_andersonii.AAC.1